MPTYGFKMPKRLEVFHWHGETFDLPPRSHRFAKSGGCVHQAFQRGVVIGLQFHLETTPESLVALIENYRAEITNIMPNKYVQSAEAMFAAPPERFAANNAVMARLLDYLANDAELKAVLASLAAAQDRFRLHSSLSPSSSSPSSSPT